MSTAKISRSDYNDNNDLVTDSHTDFQLPGLRNPIAYAKLVVALTFAYSRRGNARRLEDHFYPFWELVMDNLVYDDAFLVVAPQMTLWKGEEHANPNHSSETIVGAYMERRPDFMIMGIEACNRSIPREPAPAPDFPNVSDFPTELAQWHRMRLLTSIPLLLGEAKRPPSRHIDEPLKFRDALELQFVHGMISLHQQAVIAFHQYPTLNCSVLMAVVGEWWKFRIFERNELPELMRTTNMDMISEEEDEHDDIGYTENAENFYGKRDEFIRKFTHMQIVWKNVSDCRPDPGAYTEYLLFGSPASNQHLYYILKFLRERVAHLDDPFAKPPPHPSDVHLLCTSASDSREPYDRESMKRRDRGLDDAQARRRREGEPQVIDDDDMNLKPGDFK